MEHENIPVTDISDLPEIIDIPEDSYIIVRQLPIIEETLAALAAQIDERVNEALSMECTVETVKAVKAVRATLNKESALMEDKRKGVKTAVMEPYEKFETSYREHIGNKYRNADSQLKTKIDAVENAIKLVKRNELERYYNELCTARGIDFISFERWNPSVTLSSTPAALKKAADEYIGRICDCVEIIKERGDDQNEVMMEYQNSLNLRNAIETVLIRKENIQKQQQKRTERAAQDAAFAAARSKIETASPPPPQPLAPPTEVPAQPSAAPDDDPVMTLTFKVTHHRSALRKLKQFLIDGGYKYE